MKKPLSASTPESALDTQVGGQHYKGKAIQPVEYIHGNAIPYMEGNVIKYVSRWRDKGGVADLEKAKHYIDMLIELEAKTKLAVLSAQGDDMFKVGCRPGTLANQ